MKPRKAIPMWFRRSLDYCFCCGHFRRDHQKRRGPCKLNGLEHEGLPDCLRFRYRDDASESETQRQWALRNYGPESQRKRVFPATSSSKPR